MENKKNRGHRWLESLLTAAVLWMGGLGQGWAAEPPIRFLLSFDDGPSARATHNPTERIIGTLADNPVQPGIKALFFVQTGALNGGATARGRALMQREWAEGHLLGFHTATPGHTSHTRLPDLALGQSLDQGLAEHEALLGVRPRLVRPPAWAYDARTFVAYAERGLAVLMTDLSANDGKIVWPNFSPRRRAHLLQQMRLLSERIEALPVVQGVRPVVVTFHDPNPYTARRLTEYLQILIDAAQQAGLPLYPRPFYDEREDLERAALARALPDAEQIVRIPGFWTSVWLSLSEVFMAPERTALHAP
ncbi:peptidoglycan/xylan/chitin deacetylase (PgdA/CDA1 family) [Inhella inkyongensis]|uniref:Peptidoglycan/xylan/chitin deacetylase (PgdA/CDA1 family) n=1 Tax=Inhella inkyongensis TaxID=392593 RepID=A0A840S9U9_9BURK|nr:polysaccharide deacetylase family protein [Inhella inkyongensis]MBB5205776.1 peptidoglycan/xylan/chitin deacetylase (PgdA/CDA1 family) [Inhella inkyongensis]